MNRLCQAAGVSRAGYYRFRRRPESKPADMTLRNQIQHIALRWPAYGYRRVHAELIRQGWKINHKRVLGLLRSDNLLCVRRRKFLFTTDSRHSLPIYPNLVEELIITSIDQLWVADITYIRLQVEFVYLAVLLDAFSRRCLGWALRRSLEAALALEALHMALRRRRPKPGLVHHSDRGVQYASLGYAAELQQHGIRISMSRIASPYDNVRAESFIKGKRADAKLVCREPLLRRSSNVPDERFQPVGELGSKCRRHRGSVRRAFPYGVAVPNAGVQLPLVSFPGCHNVFRVCGIHMRVLLAEDPRTGAERSET